MMKTPVQSHKAQTILLHTVSATQAVFVWSIRVFTEGGAF
jgi:hypothetical protein